MQNSTNIRILELLRFLYRIVQDRMFESDFDHFLALEEQAERKND